ncbi:helicase C-terminal domain-containing protein, partial [Weissella soli]
LPGDQLRLVIMARLPFEQPDNIVAKAEEAVLIAQGRQPFYQSTLPKAILRFRQGVGRLIRSQDDYGAIIVFDSRLISKSYGRSVRNMMPEAMPQLEVLDTEVVPILTDFFAQHE